MPNKEPHKLLLEVFGNGLLFYQDEDGTRRLVEVMDLKNFDTLELGRRVLRLLEPGMAAEEQRVKDYNIRYDIQNRD